MGAKLPIRYYGHPDLRKRAKEVDAVTPEVKAICESMVNTMISHRNCVGFAGPQLGIMLRIFVIREEKTLPDGTFYYEKPEVIINPVLSAPSKEEEWMVEGCMSLPNFHAELPRPRSIHVRYQNLEGKFVEERVDGYRARMFMHENDHLNGTLIIDRMDPKERKRIEPVLRAMKEKYNP